MKFFLFLLTLFFANVHSFGQKNDYNWTLGYSFGNPGNGIGNAAINFNNVPPSVSNQYRSMDFHFTGTTISDSLGNLLFYDNGTMLRNRLDMMMPNGDSLAFGINYDRYGVPYPKHEIALPTPNQRDRYGLFQQRVNYLNPTDLTCDRIVNTEIDMRLNGGLGGITIKSDSVVGGNFGFGINAAKHSNGRDWWLVRPTWNWAWAYIIHYGKDGTLSARVDSLAVQPFPSTFTDQAGISSVFSPDGSKFAMSDWRIGYCYIIDFDRCEGDLGNITYIPGVFQDSRIIFSPNSRFAYLHGSNVVQYDLRLPDYWLHPDTVATYQSYPFYFGNAYFFNSEVTPDGRVFIAPTNSQQFYHVIQRPDVKGPGCMVRQHGFPLGVFNIATLPNNPNYRLGALDGSPCDTLGLDAPPLLTWAQQVQTVTEGNTQVALRMRLDRPSADTIRTSVRYVPSYGSTTVGQDLDAFPDVSVTLLPGDTSATVYVQLLDDNLPERPDTAVFAIVHPTHAVAPSWYCYLDILDNDPSGTVSTPWAEDILLYPNPAMDYLTIDARGSNIQGGRYALIDALGRILRTGDLLSQKQWLDLRDLPSGLYYLELRNEGSEEMKRMKVLKQ